ncbi:MAG: MAPEG family protein [Rhodospirillales bacterium]|nr:MAG: MAPEG family protein [Rhodospirillales bacterium]
MPHISAFYGALLAFICVGLAVSVIRHRQRSKVGIGDGGDAGLQRAIRVFGNFAEYAPLALILIALVELCGAPRVAVHIYGAVLVVGRLAHAQGLSGNPGESPGRLAGMVLTFGVLLSAAIHLLILAAPKAFG